MKKEHYIILCEFCDHSEICKILNPYECKGNFSLAHGTNFDMEILEDTDYYLSATVPSNTPIVYDT